MCDRCAPDGPFAWWITKARPLVGSRPRYQLSPFGLRYSSRRSVMDGQAPLGLCGIEIALLCVEDQLELVDRGSQRADVRAVNPAIRLAHEPCGCPARCDGSLDRRVDLLLVIHAHRSLAL